MIKNSITGQSFPHPVPNDNEILFDGGTMITETDTAGIITFANKKFRDITGYTKEELIGSPHCINCHPDMPKILFKGLWQNIKEKKLWEGYVKNICKDGSFYWVIVWVQPKFDDNGNVTGYIAGRKKPNRKRIAEIEQHYKELKESESLLHANKEMVHEIMACNL